MDEQRNRDRAEHEAEVAHRLDQPEDADDHVERRRALDERLRGDRLHGSRGADDASSATATNTVDTSASAASAALPIRAAAASGSASRRPTSATAPSAPIRPPAPNAALRYPGRPGADRQDPDREDHDQQIDGSLDRGRARRIGDQRSRARPRRDHARRRDQVRDRAALTLVHVPSPWRSVAREPRRAVPSPRRSPRSPPAPGPARRRSSAHRRSPRR